MGETEAREHEQGGHRAVLRALMVTSSLPNYLPGFGHRVTVWLFVGVAAAALHDRGPADSQAATARGSAGTGTGTGAGVGAGAGQAGRGGQWAVGSGQYASGDDRAVAKGRPEE